MAVQRNVSTTFPERQDIRSLSNLISSLLREGNEGETNENTHAPKKGNKKQSP